jgi:hypothetical protein
MKTPQEIADETDAHSTLHFLNMGDYNFDRPTEVILREFGDVLRDLHHRLKQIE